MQSGVFKPPFRGLRGNIRASSIPRWKARYQLPRVIIEHFSLALTAEALRAEISPSRCFVKGLDHVAHSEVTC